ncbi:unnamed protein product [Linum trigynum]|uniref:Prolamin-like domain-containing protein n=1 Tax=Linum trigynum TaxID=586398 RepID=A0AAV2F5P3_9ROSI
MSSFTVAKKHHQPWHSEAFTKACYKKKSSKCWEDTELVVLGKKELIDWGCCKPVLGDECADAIVDDLEAKHPNEPFAFSFREINTMCYWDSILRDPKI